MEFRLLGVLEVRADGVPLPIGGPKQRAVLAMLVLAANRVVSTDRLVEGVWDDEPPLRAAATLQVYVSNLRKVLDPGRAPRAESTVLRHRPPGYELLVDASRVDLFEFERLVAAARPLSASGCVPGAAALLREALGLWREAPLADLRDEPFARFEIPRLEEAHWSALEDRVAADLALGRHGELVAELDALIARHPYRERMRAQQMLALYRCGRQADALEAYQAARDALVEGLGLEPGRELRELEAAILVQDPSLAVEELGPMSTEQVEHVLAALDRGPPPPEVVADIVEASRHSARQAADALDQASAHRRAAQLTARLDAATVTRAELVRTRHVIADTVLDRRRRRSGPRRLDRDALDRDTTRAPCPYRGLLPFEPEDAAWYFGREQLAADVLATVASASHTTVVGASGSGKSSLVRAGLLASLRDDALPGSRDWPSLLVVPGPDPVFELARALAPRCHAASAEQVRDRLLDEPDSIVGFVERALEDGAGGSAMVLVVDQLEEVFTICRDEGLRDRFLDVLVHGAQGADGRLRVVAAVRADFLDRCAVHDDFAAIAMADSLLVGPMSTSEMQRAIELPATRAGLTLEPALIDRIFDDVGTEPGALPLLETALLETWHHREGTTMTVAGYERAGGVAGAVAHLADDVYAHLTPAQQDIAREIFLRLVEPGTGHDDVRRRAPLAELVDGDGRAAVLAKLVDRRLVVAGDTTAEVAHEAILREWPQLREWLDEGREELRLQRALASAAHDWSATQRDPALLFRGSRLAAAVELDRARPTALNPSERAFLHASQAAELAELTSARRASARFRRLSVALAALLLVAMSIGAFAAMQRSHATRNANRAERQARRSDAARLADTARNLAGSDIDLAALVALEAHRLDSSAQTEGALQNVLASAPAGLERVIRFEPAARFAQSSADGRLLFAPGTDGVIRVYSIDNGRRVRSLDGPSPGAIAPLASRDGTRIVAGSADGTVRVWDLQSGRQVVAPIETGGGGPAYGVTDPTDPTAVYVAAFDGHVARWSVADPRHPRRDPLFAIGDADASATPFPILLFVSADGSKLAVSRVTSGPTWIWDLPARRAVAQVPGTTGGFDGEGRVLTQTDGRLVRWDAASGTELSSLDIGAAGTDGIPVASPDGRRVALVPTGTADVRVLDAATGRDVISPLTLHDSTPLVRFLPDGRLLTVSSERAAVFRIDATPVPPVAHALGVGPAAVAFEPSGERIVTVGATRDVWDARTGGPIGTSTFPRRDGERRSVAPDGSTVLVLDAATGASRLEDAEGRRLADLPFVVDDPHDNVWWSPDARRLVVLTDGSMTAWDVSDPSAPRALRRLRVVGEPDDGSYVTSVVFTSRGARMAVVRERAGVVTVFDARRGGRRSVIRMPRGTASAAAFSPDGSTLAITNPTAGDGSSGVEFVDVATARPTARLDLPFSPDSIGSIAYVREGRAIALVEVTRPPVPGGDPGAARLQLWDATSLRPIGDAIPVDRIPIGLTASPDGSQLAHAFFGAPPVVWDVSVQAWRHRACAIAGRTLTRAEWRRYLPGRPFAPGCASRAPRSVRSDQPA